MKELYVVQLAVAAIAAMSLTIAGMKYLIKWIRFISHNRLPLWFAYLEQKDPLYFNNIVEKFYKALRYKKHMILDSKVIKVKKGKRKYYLIVANTPDGEVVHNIGRHLEDDDQLQMKVA